MGRKAKSEQLRETTDTFLDAIVEKFGDNVLSNVRGDNVEAMTTGSLSLDASIGIGGIPKGRFTEIMGAEGSGKTTIALTISKYALERGERVLYIDTENMLSYGSIELMLGVQFPKEQFTLVQPETAEQAFMIAEKGISSNEFSLIVLDTIAALEPQEEKDKEFDEFTMASTSRMLAKFFRRDASEVKNHNVAFLLLNQVRDNLKNSYAGYDSPGGHALKHWASVRISLSKGIDVKQGEEKIGINTKFVVRKNKLAAPFRSYELPIIFGKGVDYYTDAVSFCETLGVLKKNGAFYKFEGETLGQGRNATAEYLRNNPKTLDKIVKLLYNTLTKQSSVVLEEEGELDAV